MVSESTSLLENGDFLALVATVRTTLIAAFTASRTDGRIVAVAVEPPEVGPGGRLLLPRKTRVRDLLRRGSPARVGKNSMHYARRSNRAMQRTAGSFGERLKDEL